MYHTWLSGIHGGSTVQNGLFFVWLDATIFSPLLERTNFFPLEAMLFIYSGRTTQTWNRVDGRIL